MLADVLNRKRGGKGLLPQNGAIVFDEAHKFLDTARQMYGMTLERMELERLADSIYHSLSGNNCKKEIIRLCEEMLTQNTLLFEAFKNAAGIRYGRNRQAVSLNINCILALNALTAVLRRLSVLFFTLNYEKKESYGRLVSRMEQKQDKLAALLNHPQDMPLPQAKDGDYFQAVADRLADLIKATHGHTLILFTSYRMMEQIYTTLRSRISDFPLFMMGKGRLDAIGQFRKSGNGVLCASDSAGEGIDLAGDILSSPIVVKLPFPVSDPVLEYEKSSYGDFNSYLNEVIVPGMLMKLRQWIGRGIRRENDTCVFSILDGRAGRRYKNDILTALPEMPVSDRLSDVERFIFDKKTGGYFAKAIPAGVSQTA